MLVHPTHKQAQAQPSAPLHEADRAINSGVMVRAWRMTGRATLLAAFASTALAQTPTTPAAPAAATASNAQAEVPADSGLRADLFYQLLMGELSLRSGEAAAGFQIYLDAAQRTRRPEVFERAVEIALQSRNGDAAIQAARAWSSTLPDSREANRYVLQILLALNRLEDTAAPLRRELALSPAAERPAVLAAIPANYARANDKALAAKVVQEALSDVLAAPATAAPAWAALGRMRLAADDRTGALQAAQRGLAADQQALPPALLALELMAPNMPAAEQLVLQHLKGNDTPDLRMAYARALLDENRLAEASSEIQKVTQRQPDNAQAWLIQGSLLTQGHQAGAAEAALRRYLELVESGGAKGPRGEERNRGLAQAYLNLAQLAERRRDFTQAEVWLNRIENSQELMAAQNRRASIMARQGKLDEARALLRSLPARGEEGERMRLAAEVALLRDNQQYQAAYDLLKDAVARSPEDDDWIYDKAMMAEKIGRFDEMEQLLRSLIARKPDHHHAYNALGYSLADRGQRLTEARELIRKALSMAPNDPFITDSLGWVEFRLGNLPEALRILEQAYKARPDSEIAAHLGEVLWVMGQRERALVVWREGVLQDADNETLRQTLKRLSVAL
jgi:tetratricopeptide (TPR) repeat protein